MLAVEVFQCLPDELSARLDALGADRGRRALIELLAHYEIKSQDKRIEEWERAIDEKTGRRKGERFLGDQNPGA